MHNNKMQKAYIHDKFNKYLCMNRLYHEKQIIRYIIIDSINQSERPFVYVTNVAKYTVRDDREETGLKYHIWFDLPQHHQKSSQDVGIRPQSNEMGEEKQNEPFFQISKYVRDRKAHSTNNWPKKYKIPKRNLGKVLDGDTDKKKIEYQNVEVGDSIFNLELKKYVRGTLPVPEDKKSYLSRFFFDYKFSGALRKVVWRERVGNRLKMSRVLYNNLLVRASQEGLEPSMDQIMVEDLIRTCSVIDSATEHDKMYEDLRLVLTVFAVCRLF